MKWSNQRPGVDPGWPFLFAFERQRHRATHQRLKNYSFSSSKFRRFASNTAVAVIDLCMRNSILKQMWLAVLIGALSLTQGLAAQKISKTIRVEHGRPVIVVSQRSVLVLEFVQESSADAI